MYNIKCINYGIFPLKTQSTIIVPFFSTKQWVLRYTEPKESPFFNNLTTLLPRLTLIMAVKFSQCFIQHSVKEAHRWEEV
jgi:hypothetical protein